MCNEKLHGAIEKLGKLIILEDFQVNSNLAKL
jgi:hypothetical protein